MKHPISNLWLATAAVLLCSSCSDRENVSYNFVSKTSSGDSEAGVVVRAWNGRSLQHVYGPGQTHGVPIALAHETIDRNTGGSETVTLAVHSDALLVQKAWSLLLVSPALPNGQLSLPADSKVLIAPDSATLFSIVTPKTAQRASKHWHVSAHGNLIILEDDNGLSVHMPGRAVVEYTSNATLSTSAQSYLVKLPRGDSILIPPPSVKGPDSQMAFLSERESVRFFGPDGKVTAELPSKGLEIQDRSQGLLLIGSYPAGVPGVLDEAFTIFLPLNSHHLLLLRGARR